MKIVIRKLSLQCAQEENIQLSAEVKALLTLITCCKGKGVANSSLLLA